MYLDRVILVAVAAVTAGGLLVGCGGSAATSPPPSVRTTPAASLERHNQADVAFLQDMLVHHIQTGVMSDLAHSKASSRVKTIALRIKAAQDQQITRIHNLLSAWGAPTPAGGSGNGEVPGLLSDQQIQQLRTATGNDFDRSFLQLMISHQQGAIQMSQTQVTQGSDPQARRLAEDTIAGQQSEINQMQRLLQSS